ncbi:unnamed protein product [Tilletia laevis]|uniref:FHA domain-containing protein n=2 Tax=Tilletia TaxID=13289 RepID=A0A177T2X1_9BASI|nr:hypothetical protein CF336_g9036 [Tilletia laevis]KAE8238971.1 hypothetical protein A4X03_0g8734 [Tilletia caries]CAD6976646.1 unnamed protein product [Tilletia controversa]KAE8183472.1 hypothetical protein CF335_g8312 [Tilletia laevis]CAD6885445.1 unnamed protein product [Tilletia caries]
MPSDDITVQLQFDPVITAFAPKTFSLRPSVKLQIDLVGSSSVNTCPRHDNAVFPSRALDHSPARIVCHGSYFSFETSVPDSNSIRVDGYLLHNYTHTLRDGDCLEFGAASHVGWEEEYDSDGDYQCWPTYSFVPDLAIHVHIAFPIGFDERRVWTELGATPVIFRPPSPLPQLASPSVPSRTTTPPLATNWRRSTVRFVEHPRDEDRPESQMEMLRMQHDQQLQKAQAPPSANSLDCGHGSPPVRVPYGDLVANLRSRASSHNTKGSPEAHGSDHAPSTSSPNASSPAVASAERAPSTHHARFRSPNQEGDPSSDDPDRAGKEGDDTLCDDGSSRVRTSLPDDATTANSAASTIDDNVSSPANRTSVSSSVLKHLPAEGDNEPAASATESIPPTVVSSNLTDQSMSASRTSYSASVRAACLALHRVGSAWQSACQEIQRGRRERLVDATLHRLQTVLDQLRVRPLWKSPGRSADGPAMVDSTKHSPAPDRFSSSSFQSSSSKPRLPSSSPSDPGIELSTFGMTASPSTPAAIPPVHHPSFHPTLPHQLFPTSLSHPISIAGPSAIWVAPPSFWHPITLLRPLLLCHPNIFTSFLHPP